MTATTSRPNPTTTGRRPADNTRKPLRVRARLTVGALLFLVTVVPVAVALAAPPRLEWWAVGAIVGALVLLSMITVRGRTFAQWVRDRRRFRRSRKAEVQAPNKIAPARTVNGVGFRPDGFTLVSVIELAPQLSETRLEGGRGFTTSTVPIDLLTQMMNQYGLEVDIDVVGAGCRVPEKSPTRSSTAQFVRAFAAIGERTTWLVLRVNQLDNLEGITERGPSGVAAQRALAAATERLVQRLQQRQLRARALSEEELAELDERLCGAFALDATTTEHWSHMQAGGRYSATYSLDPAVLSTAALDRCWAVDTENTVVVVRLHRRDNEAEVSALVRFDTTSVLKGLGIEGLELIAGRQAEGFYSTLPAGDRSMKLPLPTAPIGDMEDVEIPIGPAGQIWGISGSSAIALPLYDQTALPERYQIDMRVSMLAAQLAVLRAVGLGAVVELHTAEPRRWRRLLAEVADDRQLFLAGTAGRAADIAVFDGVPVETVPARSTMLVHSPADEVLLPSAEIKIQQLDAERLQLTVRGGAPIVVSPIPSLDEERYLGISRDAGRPRRAATQPQQQQTRRRPARASVEPPAAPAAPAAPVRPAVPPRPPLAPETPPVEPPTHPRGAGNTSSLPGNPGPSSRAAGEPPAPQEQQPARHQTGEPPRSPRRAPAAPTADPAAGRHHRGPRLPAASNEGVEAELARRRRLRSEQQGSGAQQEESKRSPRRQLAPPPPPRRRRDSE